MSIQETFISLLGTHANIYHKDSKPKGATKFILYYVIDAIPQRDLKTTMHLKYRVQFACYDVGAKKSDDLANLVVADMDNNSTDFYFSYVISKSETDLAELPLYCTYVDVFIIE